MLYRLFKFEVYRRSFMKKFERWRIIFGMTRMLATLAFGMALVLALGFASCKADAETEYVTKEVDKTYASAVTFTVSETNTEGVLSLTMQSATEGAVIYYTADGSTPTTDSSKYTAALTVSADAVYKAVAVKEGIENSPVSTASVSIKEKKMTVEVEKTYASAVTFTVSEMNTEGVLSLTMQSATEGAVIYYTADGSTPTTDSSKYTAALTVSADAVYKAVAVKEGIENSPVSVATVSIKEKKVTVEVDKKADESAPASVTNLKATAKDSRVLLTWTDAADSDIYGYEVSYSGSKAINRVVLPALNSTSMIVPQGAGGTYVSGLTNGTEYTFIVKTVDTSGNKSDGVSVKATPVAGETLKITLAANVPNKNKLGQDYSGNKSNTKVTVTANITTASTVKKVVWKKNGSLNAKTLFADTTATAASVSDDNAKWTFDITATDETANGTYTVAAIDEAGREEAEQISIDNFDFTPPSTVKVTYGIYDKNKSEILLIWTEPGNSDYDHVDISFTSNNGTADSEPSTVESVTKGTANKTYSGIDGAKAYYTYTFVTYDTLGNAGETYTWKVGVVNTNVVNILEGFVTVAGTTIKGNETWTPSSNVFVSGRSLYIPDLYVCDHEVTRGEFKALMGVDPSTADAYDKDGNKLTGDAVLNNPVNYVNWYAAIAYCNKLSIKEGLDCAYTVSGINDWENLAYSAIPTSGDSTWNAATCDFTANGYRLPTEAEWEWLARGGQNYTYAGSDTVDDVAWYIGNTNNTGSRYVKTKTANGYELYDMSGNVWEWCWDWCGTISSFTGAFGASSGDCRVQRGGSWNNGAGICEVPNRYKNFPYGRYDFCGFRLVRNAN